MTQVSNQFGIEISKSPQAASCCPSAFDKLMVVDFFEALADPNRARIFSCLARCVRPCSVSEIAECCSIDFSVVSRHLKILEQGEIVSSKKEGRTVWYQVEHSKVAQRLHGIAQELEQYLKVSKMSCC